MTFRRRRWQGGPSILRCPTLHADQSRRPPCLPRAALDRARAAARSRARRGARANRGRGHLPLGRRPGRRRVGLPAAGGARPRGRGRRRGSRAGGDVGCAGPPRAAQHGARLRPLPSLPRRAPDPVSGGSRRHGRGTADDRAEPDLGRRRAPSRRMRCSAASPSTPSWRSAACSRSPTTCRPTWPPSSAAP